MVKITKRRYSWDSHYVDQAERQAEQRKMNLREYLDKLVIQDADASEIDTIKKRIEKIEKEIKELKSRK